MVTYFDSANSLNCTSGGSGICSWAANWVIGSGDLVDPGERVEMIVTLSSLTPLLGKNTEFTIEVRANKGAVVVVNRTIPGEVKAVMELYSVGAQNLRLGCWHLGSHLRRPPPVDLAHE